MLKFFPKLLIVLLLVFGFCPINAQEPLPLGSLEVSGRVKINGKLEKLQRKRFYLLRGGLDENKNLVEKLGAAETLSRDCFYSQMQASPQFICWLKEENCESPYCREIEKTDIESVPEFQTAFQKGLRQFGKSRPEISQNWLITNLSPTLSAGFYLRQKSLLESLLGKVKPLQSSMTDSVSVKAIFIDIPLNLPETDGKKKKSETFLVSNLLPLEFGDKTYVWACETEIGNQKQGKLVLQVPEGDKKVKNCEVFVKDLPVCKTENCKK
jgi:hypothetical protein